MIRDMFEEMPILSSIIALLFSGVLFIIVDMINSDSEPFYGVIVDKHYKAEINSTGTGYGMTSSGKMGMVTTSQRESEDFLVMVKTDRGGIYTVSVSAELYYEKEIGNKIDCVKHIGLFTGIVWGYKGIK